MFLTMTPLPETPATTRSFLNWWLRKMPAMTFETSFSSMIWPSTTVSGWSPSKPRLTSESALSLPVSSTALTELEPMSRPTSPFVPGLRLNIGYLFLAVWRCRLRWRRRRRARRTLSRVARPCGVGVAGFMAGGVTFVCGRGVKVFSRARPGRGGLAADACAACVSGREEEGVASGSGGAPFGRLRLNKISPSATRLSRGLLRGRPTPVALRPTLARSVPLSVEFQTAAGLSETR
jgi:hypothetical protein